LAVEIVSAIIEVARPSETIPNPKLSAPELPLVLHFFVLQVTRLSALNKTQDGPVAFRPMVTHGLANQIHPFTSMSSLLFDRGA
jgi:hypothetical protein